MVNLACMQGAELHTLQNERAQLIDMSSCAEVVSPGRVHRHATKEYEGTDGAESGALPLFLLASEHCEGQPAYGSQCEV